MASAVSGFRVRRSTWMIWNSRSARLIGILSGVMASLLTARWQQALASLSHFPTDEESQHDHPLWLRRRLRSAGNQPVRDQDRGSAQDGRSGLSQGTGDA